MGYAGENDENVIKVKHGLVSVADGKGSTEPIRLQLTQDTLILQKEAPASTPDTEGEGSILNKVRHVTLYREACSFGLSVKGGSEHRLPVLISKIIPGQAAEKSEQLFVGDAILKINGLNTEHSGHDNVVELLKKSGDIVTLTVKHFKPASIFLNKGNKAKDSNQSGASLPGCSREKAWLDALTIPLIFAYLTRYCPGTDKLRPSGFELISADGIPSGIIHCDTSQALSEWIRCIATNITTVINSTIQNTNKLLLPHEKINYLCWISERISPTRHWHAWKPRFLALKGPQLYLMDSPPTDTRCWEECENVYKVYECMFKLPKDSELLDDRPHCILIQTGSGESFYISVESRTDLLRLEKAWYKTNHQAVTKLRNKTFGCTWRGRISGITLDLNAGFSLYDSESRSYMWTYRFSQLKGSSDDSKTKLKLHFQHETSKKTENREIECTNLKALLFCIHAFLSAKLASVDPTFLSSF